MTVAVGATQAFLDATCTDWEEVGAFCFIMTCKLGVFCDLTHRNLIIPVLRESFHLYVGRYFFTSGLIGVSAVNTALTAYIMKYVSAAVFGDANSTAPGPSLAEAHSNPEWLRQLGGFAEVFLPQSSLGLPHPMGLSILMVLVFAINGGNNFRSSVILSKIGDNLVARQQHRFSNHFLKQLLPFSGLFSSSSLIARVSHAATAASESMHLMILRVQHVLSTPVLMITKLLRLKHAGKIRPRGMGFAYRKSLPVLYDVSLVSPGDNLSALMGPSGNCKSILLSLIDRFYFMETGEVEIADLPNRSGCSQRALVSQDTFIFPDTVLHSIRFVRADATDAGVAAAASVASMHDFMVHQTQSYNITVSEHGANLPGATASPFPSCLLSSKTRSSSCSTKQPRAWTSTPSIRSNRASTVS